MTSNDSSFRSLRIMLEAQLPSRALIVASSALDGDGQDELAHGVAHAFADSGKRTAFISVYNGGGKPQRHLGRRCAHLTRIGVSIGGRNDLKPVIANARENHDFVIIAGPPVASYSGSLDLCRLADGVLLAVRLGRKVTDADQRTAGQLKLVAANVLGVIAMRPPVPAQADPNLRLEALRSTSTRFLGAVALRLAAARSGTLELARNLAARLRVRAGSEQLNERAWWKA
jgi:Mrp family chromosome partitioning ATPase